MEEQGAYEVKQVDHNEVVPLSTAPQEDSTANIVLVAMQKGYDPVFIEKMMDLAERNEKNVARKAYYEAVAGFKAEAPPVRKDKYNTFFKSWYTSLGNLLDTYNPVLGKYGLSISFPTPTQTDTSMTAECRLSHRLGHSESVSITAPIDKAAIGKASGERSRNAIQDIKSTFTYLRSATAEAILGVTGTEASQDDDGNGAGKTEYITEEQVSRIRDYIDNYKVNEAKFLQFLKVETVEKIPAKAFQMAINSLEAKKKAVEK